MVTAHTDVVGSLLRPPALLDARRRFEQGELQPAEFKPIEDAAVDAAVALQEQAGLDVVTDGEMRRLSFQSGLPDAVDGFGEVPLEAYLWGEWHGDERVGDRATERPPRLGVREPLRRRRHIAAEELTYLRGRTSRIAKITLTSPSLYANLWSPELSRDAYPTLDELPGRRRRDPARRGARAGPAGRDLPPAGRASLPAADRPGHARVLRVAGLVARALARPRHRARQRRDRRRTRASPSASTCAAATRAAAGSSPAATTRSPPGCSAASTPSGCCSSTTTSARAHSSRCAEVPDDRMVVLGLVTTKSGRRETVEELERRTREAAALRRPGAAGDQPQCGFATSVVGNALTQDDERAKLETIARASAVIWG